MNKRRHIIGVENISKLVEIGEEARNFSLPDQNGEVVMLSDLEGRKVLLSFHPLAWTTVCRKQMESLDENYDRFKNKNVIPLGISIDPIPSKKAWVKEIGLEKLRIFSDFWPHGKVAEKYGVFRKKDGFSERANILINEDRKIEFVKIYEMSEVPNIGELLQVMD